MNKAPIEHRAVKVSLAMGVSTILYTAVQLLSVPVCLHYWGKETYGRWLALFSAFVLIRSLDGGYVVFVGNKLNYLYHRSIAELREHLASALFGTTLINCAQLALAIGALTVAPLAAILGMSADHPSDFTGTMGILILVISWALTGSYLGIVHKLLTPAGLMYQQTWWAMVFQVSQFIAIMASAVLGFDMLYTSMLVALAQALSFVAAALYVRRAQPSFFPWLYGATVRVGLRDLRQSAFLTTSNMIQQGTLNGTVLLVSFLAGPIAVPVFTTVRTLTNLWSTVTTVLSTPLLPDVVRIHAKGEVQKLVAMNQAYWVLVGSAVNLGALLSYPLVPFLYGEWTAHTVALDTSLLCLLLASAVVANAGALMAVHLNGINSLRIVLGASVARAVFGLGVGIFGFRQYGLTAFGWGILLAEIIATLMTVIHFVRYEFTAKGVQISAAYFGPVCLSTGTVLLYFVGAGLAWYSIGWVWLIAIAGVAAASGWGWTHMEPELQIRLKCMIVGVFVR